MKAKISSLLTSQARTVVLLALMLAALTAHAASQSGCLKGNVMFAMGVNGNVELCSQYLDKIPELQRQLDQLQKTASGDQELLRELTRSARSVNALGRNVDSTRQVELLRSFSYELQGLISADQKKTLQQMAQLADKLNNLQDMITQSKEDQQTAVQTMNALNGQLGDAIARLDVSRTEALLEDIRSQLKGIRSEVGAVHSDTSDIKKDTSEIRKAMACTSATAEALRLSLQSHLLDQVTQNLRCNPENGSDAKAGEIVAQMFKRENFRQNQDFLEAFWKTSLVPSAIVCQAAHQAMRSEPDETLVWLFSRTPNGTIQGCNKFSYELVGRLALAADESNQSISRLTQAGLSLDFDRYALFRAAYESYLDPMYGLMGFKEVSDAVAPPSLQAFHAAREKAELDLSNERGPMSEFQKKRIAAYCPTGKSYCAGFVPPPEPVPPAVFVDRESSLTWTTKATSMTWSKAGEYCTNLRLSGYKDWRLPQLEELQTIFDPSEDKNEHCMGLRGSLPIHIRKQLDVGCGGVWADKKAGRGNLFGYDEEYAWLFDFETGKPVKGTIYFELKKDGGGDAHDVLCVRGRSSATAATSPPSAMPAADRSPLQTAAKPTEHAANPSTATTDHELQTEIATVAWVAIAGETCGWKLPADQDENMRRYMAAIQAWEKFNPKYWLNSDIAQYRYKINEAGRTDFCESPLIRQRFQERAATLWPKGTVAAPPSK